MFTPVTADAFLAALAAAPASAALREQFARFEGFEVWLQQSAVVHDGPLAVAGSWRAPALCTLVTGGLTASDVIDLDSGVDAGGLLVVVGPLACRHLVGLEAACVFVDGNLAARESIVTGFEDSSLVVIGKLSARLFVGGDVWAEVGDGAAIDYGIGYCLPLGYEDAAAQAIMPRHGEEETASAVTVGPSAAGYFDAYDFAELVRTGQPIFR